MSRSPPTPEFNLEPLQRPGAGALRELAVLFFRLGTTAFGGPAAHIAMMEEEVVRRRRWLTHDEFLDLLSAANLIPGPNSTELAIHIGHRRAGFPGLLVAGACFIVPAMLMTAAIGWAYVRYGSLPVSEALLYGIKPPIVAVVIQAIWKLGRTAVKTRALAALGLACLVMALLGVNELALLFGAGGLLMLLRHVQGPAGGRALPLALLLPLAVSQASVAVPFSASLLFLVFLKVGAVLFGSGYVLMAFLRADLVERLGWLTEAQLLDAVAVGQITPGPVFTSATFIGFVLDGPWGAGLATLGIFLPAFFFVALTGPLVPRLRSSALAGAFLDGVNVASLALMAAVTLQLAGTAIIDVPSLLLAVAGAVLLLRFRLGSVWLVLGGAVVGLLRAAW